MATFTVKIDGQTLTKRSAARNYDYAVLTRPPTQADTKLPWRAFSWATKYPLAERKAQDAQRAGLVAIIQLTTKAEDPEPERPEPEPPLVPANPSPTCRRCGRALTNPKHRERGYGDTCWQKTQAQARLDQATAPEPPGTPMPTDPLAAAYTRCAIEELAAPQTCARCGTPLRQGTLEHYDHPDGFTSPGYEHPQWFYITCAGCHYQWSAWKLGIDQAQLEAETEELKAIGGRVEGYQAREEHVHVEEADSPGPQEAPGTSDHATRVEQFKVNAGRFLEALANIQEEPPQDPEA